MHLTHQIILPDKVKKIMQVFLNRKFKIFAVGGCVRDSLLEKKPKDWDLATDATIGEIQNICKDQGWKWLALGESFEISFVVVEDESFEIATFRKDLTPGRKPLTAIGTIQDDAERRDFTMNALFADIDGNIIDFFNGLEDISKKILRAVRDPKLRFSEDKLRKIRAFRFTANLGLNLHESTWNAIVEDPFLDGVSKERIREEFSKVKNFETFAKLIRNSGVFFEIFFDAALIRNWTFEEDLTSEVFIAQIFDRAGIHPSVPLLMQFWKSSKEFANSIWCLHMISKALRDPEVFKETPWSRIQKTMKENSTLTLESGKKFFGIESFIFEKIWNAEIPNFSENLIASGFSGKALGNEILKKTSQFIHSLI